MKIISLLLVVFCFVLYLSLRNHKSKIVLNVYNSDKSVRIVVFDWDTLSITTLNMPANLEIEVARELGTWPLGSVWELGENEGLSGELLAETTGRSLKIPTGFWANDKANGIISSNVFSRLKALFSVYKTNLNLTDRLNLFFLSLRVKPNNREDINLTDTNFLQKAQLKDGSEGYKINGRLPTKISTVFTEGSLSRKNLKVLVTNLSGNYSLDSDVAAIIEVIGAKVTSVQKGELGNFDCIVLGNLPEVIKILSDDLKCGINFNKKPEGNFDVEIQIGSIFNQTH
ncbi:hypothetical protein A3D00_00310 [Candidatus Woesebacteria bacterium RIFCSPHIGHO2_02_FULL_38_9]|uniref:LytR/CpsA/Psr regulator C-terminal domain-containing protein n=1 Tax=Candidatus Woesebacteria bacterium RIFCSPHIGHO2_01_FULL_39_28 TaxID=1802496 RepID=A0A1F7YBF0_9BACT|nr:MAG: hypothetical protein A2627_02600 [Candidatus Woesebacteria bacterium RIFCSPHIGHO2_01_FULL_39_28]OGM33112.1 MAG: hypothetical protein A3D00_00310 [Candidatus Woesebacteria bacterium RIFCSPHIGHO2_02_FULL_38_9]OGM58392.1 MAG: hypothetical protein A3A50_02525 [Candidatus Woesebacteria bacterium RIFCSPLOWO2_01_FULL_38_20]